MTSPKLTAVGTLASGMAVQLSLGLRSLQSVENDAEKQRRLAFAITAALTEKGWGHADLARALGISKATAGRWAKGDTVPNLLWAKPLADALEVRPELLMEPPPVPVTDYPLSEYLVRRATEQGAADAEARAPRRRRRSTAASS